MTFLVAVLILALLGPRAFRTIADLADRAVLPMAAPPSRPSRWRLRLTVGAELFVLLAGGLLVLLATSLASVGPVAR